MLVFIDEAGDPGFKPSASPIFVAVMVVFDTAQDATKTQECIELSDARDVHKSEFKFSKCSDGVRDLFFAAVRGCPFRVRAIVVRKEVIYSPRLKADKDRFYEYFVKNMMDYNGGILKDARVVIDGSGDRLFRKNLGTALRRRLGKGVLKDIRFKASHSDVLVQLADMCAGAIARSYRAERSCAIGMVRLGSPLGSTMCRTLNSCAPEAYSRRYRARTPYGGSSEHGGGLAAGI